MPCPGYKDFIMHSKTPHVGDEGSAAPEQLQQQLTQNPTIPLAVDEDGSWPCLILDSLSTNLTSSTCSGNELPALPLMVPEPCWEEESLCYFVQQHVIPASSDVSLPGHLDFLPSLYINSADDSCIRPAIQATAYLSLSNLSKSSSLQIRARGAYLAALNAVNRAIHSADSVKDETLAAVMLLSLFEVSSEFLTDRLERACPLTCSQDMNMERTNIRNLHSAWIVHLLQSRCTKPLDSRMDVSLFGWAFTQVVSGILSELRIPVQGSHIYHLDNRLLPDWDSRL